jgi:hypothetical protein
MPILDLSINLGTGQTFTATCSIRGPGTLAEVSEMMAAAVHAIFEQATAVDRNSNSEGRLLKAISDRIDELNVDPKNAGVINCRIETKPMKGNPDERP